MGGAILAGLLKSGISPNNISVSTKTTESAERLADELGVLSFAMEDGDDANQMAVANAQLVLIGVKPAYVLEVLADVADSLNDNALVVSVAAGVPTAAMEAVLPEDVGVIRAMPNTPAIVGRALTGIAAGFAVAAVGLAVRPGTRSAGHAGLDALDRHAGLVFAGRDWRGAHFGCARRWRAAVALALAFVRAGVGVWRWRSSSRNQWLGCFCPFVGVGCARFGSGRVQSLGECGIASHCT